MTETYTLSGYGKMVGDATRTGTYVRALEAVVRPGMVVLDIGTGTGVFALAAARLGARRVYGVEPADAIRTARQVARDNGLADRIEFIQEISTRVSLPERADVIVFDLRGALPAFQNVVATVADARQRLLAPGGVLIPRADTLWAAPVEAAELWDSIAGPDRVEGFDLGAARRMALSEWGRDFMEPQQLLAPGAPWARLDYATVTDPSLRGTVQWTAERAGTAHGLAVWFHAELAEGIGFHSGPGSRTVYRTALFPWPHPVALSTGDRVRAELRARWTGGDYLWMWNSTVERAGQPLVEFRQSTFAASPPSPERLRRSGDASRPALGEDGRITAYVLSRMDGGPTLRELAAEVCRRFPARFATPEVALVHVSALSDRYGA